MTSVAVVGLGPMGRGIARVFAGAGAEVVVFDADAAALERFREEEPSLRAAASLADAVGEAELVIEAIVERPDAKASLLADIRAAAAPGLVVASNTSSLSIGELGVAYGDPASVIGLHFFNPPEKMRLVEIVRGPHTSDEVVARAESWVERLGKTGIVCVDSPNFVVNRVCRPLYYESQLLVTQGVAPAVVDAVARSALGHRMGPLELLDFTGLHTHLGSSETAHREFGDPRYRPIPRTRSLVRAGATGRAAGRGWYDHAASSPADERAKVLTERAASGADPGVVVHRDEDVVAVRGLVERGEQVVVDSSHGRWLEGLPRGAGWVRLHGTFAEVVHDPVAGIVPPRFVEELLSSLGASSVEVLALPGLVGDRLMHTLVNEAVTVVEEGTADANAVDLALRLGMNHPLGPFEYLEQVGDAVVLESLRGMLDAFGDPRYRPAPLLMRRAARRP